MTFFLQNRLIYNTDILDSRESLSEAPLSNEEKLALQSLESSKVMGNPFPDLEKLDMQKDAVQAKLIPIFNGVFSDDFKIDTKNPAEKNSLVLESDSNKIVIEGGRIDLYSPIDYAEGSGKVFDRANTFGFPNHSIRKLKEALQTNDLPQVKSLMKENTTYADSKMGAVIESSIGIKNDEVVFQRSGKSYTEALGFQDINGTPCAFLSQVAG